jgi:hypothetical protein
MTVANCRSPRARSRPECCDRLRLRAPCRRPHDQRHRSSHERPGTHRALCYTTRALDPALHKRYLAYRELHAHFATARARSLTADEFSRADAEHRALEAKGDLRTDEEEARFAKLTALLHRD